MTEEKKLEKRFIRACKSLYKWKRRESARVFTEIDLNEICYIINSVEVEFSMRKASALCFYKESTNQIYRLDVKSPRMPEYVTLIRYGFHDAVQPYCYKTFWELYDSVLRICKENGFLVYRTECFGSWLYDIRFVNIENPNAIEINTYFHGRVKNEN